MDSDFIPEKSRIDFWEWNDKDGNIWFRIDDEGTGMTMGMLQRYFLKVGKFILYFQGNRKRLKRSPSNRKVLWYQSFWNWFSVMFS